MAIQATARSRYILKGARPPVCACTEITAIAASANYDVVSLNRDRSSGSVHNLPTTTTSSVILKAPAAASHDQQFHGGQSRVRDLERAVRRERVDGVVAVVGDAVAAGGEELGGRTAARVVFSGARVVVARG